MTFKIPTAWTLICLMAVFFSNLALSQDAEYDKVLMNSGEQKVGHVTKMGDTSIEFVHKGETLSYTLSKSDINKIEFASGRIEFIGQEEGTEVELGEHHNVVASLPFVYISNVQEKMVDQMSVKIQGDCITLLKEKSKEFTFQDPITTNALLKKHNVTVENISGFTPSEIAHILNVEYVIYGTVSVSNTGSSSSGGGYYDAKHKGNKTTGYTIGTSSTSKNYSTTVQMNIYNESGDNLFTKSHESFWQTDDAYMITLNYLIKRSPFYSK